MVQRSNPPFLSDPFRVDMPNSKGTMQWVSDEVVELIDRFEKNKDRVIE